MGYNRIAASAPRDLTPPFCPRKCREILIQDLLEDFPDNLLLGEKLETDRFPRYGQARIVKRSKPLDSSPGRM
jgi:hypothetical protein